MNSTIQRWCMSHRADPGALPIADRHYSRQQPGTPQFVAAGSCAVFLSDCGHAVWVSLYQCPEFVDHAWPNAWQCSMFRNEGAGLATDLIRLAVAATRAHYGEPPSLGMITFIDTEEVRPTMVRGFPVWGWTFRKAGFVDAGETQGGLLALQLWPDAMPTALAAKPRTMHGTPLFDAKAA